MIIEEYIRRKHDPPIYQEFHSRHILRSVVVDVENNTVIINADDPGKSKSHSEQMEGDSGRDD